MSAEPIARPRRPYVPRQHRRERRTSAGIAMPRVDMRTIHGRRFRNLVNAFAAELGNQLTEADKGLIGQIAAMQIKIEGQQAAIVEGRDVDADQVIRLSSEHRRLLSALRTKSARNKPAGPTIADYIARKVAEKAASAPDDAA